MKTYRLVTTLCLFILLFCQCETVEKREVNSAFYHWQTILEINEFEQNYLENINSKRLYVKFFDIDINENIPIPKALLQVKKAPDSIEIVPTIFITNRTFTKIKDQEIKALAERTNSKIKSIYKKLKAKPIQEIQLDCDWSEKTKRAYFQFLTEMKALNPNIDLSATIRLHQIKYFERTGVPPVHRGMLMLYNMGQLTNWNTSNSILDLAILDRYLTNFENYPLTLDLALPLFRWGVLFREGKMVRLLNNLDDQDLRDTTFTKIDSTHYQVKENTYLKGHYIYKNDHIRLEKVDSNLLLKTTEKIASIFPSDHFWLTFYHIDSTVVQQYEVETFFSLENILKNN